VTPTTVRAVFEDLVWDSTQFTALRAFDEDAEDFDGYATELEDGYVDPPWLYCDAGTDLWRRMVDAGRLTGSESWWYGLSGTTTTT
jgi:hypothetical protein